MMSKNIGVHASKSGYVICEVQLIGEVQKLTDLRVNPKMSIAELIADLKFFQQGLGWLENLYCNPLPSLLKTLEGVGSPKSCDIDTNDVTFLVTALYHDGKLDLSENPGIIEELNTLQEDEINPKLFAFFYAVLGADIERQSGSIFDS